MKKTTNDDNYEYDCNSAIQPGIKKKKVGPVD